MLLVLLIGVLAAYWLQQMIYRKFWRKNLLVQTEFTDACVYEGDTSYLREEITNDKLLPLPALEVRLSMSRNLEFSREAKSNSSITDQSYRRDMFSFLFHQKVIHTLPFACRRRGFYQISQADVVSYDLFFHPGGYLSVPQQTQLYVYPAQTDVRRIRLLCQAVSGMILVQNRLYPDPFAFSGIREYLPTDPMHHINWKASARNASLMVNQFDSTANVRTTVILDTEDSNILRCEALTEEGIRIASSLAARMVREKMELRLIGNAAYEEPASGQSHAKPLSWFLKPGAGRISELNRKLACIDTQEPIEPVEHLLQKEAEKKASGQVYVLISKNQRESILAGLRVIAANGNQVLWVVPISPQTQLFFRETPHIRMMRWEVSV